MMQRLERRLAASEVVWCQGDNPKKSVDILGAHLSLSHARRNLIHINP